MTIAHKRKTYREFASCRVVVRRLTQSMHRPGMSRSWGEAAEATARPGFYMLIRAHIYLAREFSNDHGLLDRSSSPTNEDFSEEASSREPETAAAEVDSTHPTGSEVSWAKD